MTLPLLREPSTTSGHAGRNTSTTPLWKNCWPICSPRTKCRCPPDRTTVSGEHLDVGLCQGVEPVDILLNHSVSQDIAPGRRGRTDPDGECDRLARRNVAGQIETLRFGAPGSGRVAGAREIDAQTHRIGAVGVPGFAAGVRQRNGISF